MHCGVHGFLLHLPWEYYLYFLLTVKWRDRFEGAVPVTRKQIFFFLSAMILLYIVKGSPVDLLGHILFYVHMIQMALLLFLVAPLLIMGIPSWIWQKVFDLKIIGSIFRVFTKPVIWSRTFCVNVFNVSLSICFGCY